LGKKKFSLRILDKRLRGGGGKQEAGDRKGGKRRREKGKRIFVLF